MKMFNPYKGQIKYIKETINNKNPFMFVSPKGMIAGGMADEDIASMIVIMTVALKKYGFSKKDILAAVDIGMNIKVEGKYEDSHTSEKQEEENE